MLSRYLFDLNLLNDLFDLIGFSIQSSGFQVSVSGPPDLASIAAIFRFHTTLPNLWRAM